MRLYLGNKQTKLIINNITYKPNLITSTDNNKILLSSDNYVLKSLDEYYLLTKEEEKNG